MHYRHLLSTRHWEFTASQNHHKAKQGRSAPSSTFFKCASTLDCLFTCKREAAKCFLELIYLAGAYKRLDSIKMVSRLFRPDVSFCRFLFWNNSQKEDLLTSCLEGITLAFSILNLGRQRNTVYYAYKILSSSFHQGTTSHLPLLLVSQSGALWFSILLVVGELYCLITEVGT